MGLRRLWRGEIWRFGVYGVEIYGASEVMVRKNNELGRLGKEKL